MKVILIAALSADGFIARHEHELADWTSKEDKQLFVQLTKEAGVLVMGGTTYRTIGKALPGRRNIIYSRHITDEAGIETTQEAPAALLERLASEGHESVAICGGRSIYDLFLTSGLVTDVYLSIEPVLFGSGVSLSATAMNVPLKLVESRQLNDNTTLNHYEVIA